MFLVEPVLKSGVGTTACCLDLANACIYFGSLYFLYVLLILVS